MLATNDAAVIFQWVYDHLALVGYTGVGIFVWKTRGLLSDLTSIAKKTVEQIDTLATNHFPHMEESLKNQDGLLHSMDGSLKTLVTQQVKFSTPRRPSRRKTTTSKRRK